MAEAIAFYAFGGLAVIFSLLMITRRNPVSSAWSLVVVMICLAALFVILNATFVAAMQIIVYAGAVMVLFLYVIMLLNLSDAEIGKVKITGAKVFGGILAFVMLVMLISMSILAAGEGAFVEEGFGQIQPVAMVLFTKYLLPFEVTGILLLAAIIGAVMMAQKEKGKQ